MPSVHVVSPNAAAGKTLWTVALTCALRKRGHKVAVVKPIAVVSPDELTTEGISLAAAHLAAAAGVRPSGWTNPVVAKSADGLRAEVTILGRSIGEVPLLGRDAVLLDELPQASQTDVSDVIAEAVERARARAEVVLTEGAGGVADLMTLGAWDPANIDLMTAADASVLVARFSRGGALASVSGALDLLGAKLGGHARGLALNDVRARISTVRCVAEEFASARGIEFLGLTPWIPHFQNRPGFAPGSAEADKDHAVLAEAFSASARWPVIEQLLRLEACSTHL